MVTGPDGLSKIKDMIYVKSKPSEIEELKPEPKPQPQQQELFKQADDTSKDDCPF